jgi:hypothetical protein
MHVATEVYRQKLQMLLDELSASELREVYHFTVFLHQRRGKKEALTELPSVPAEHLRSLVGLIAIGGDALRDTEELYQ